MKNRSQELKKYLVPGKHVHLVGIGGVSMRPLGLVLKGMGLTVTGSDMSASASTDELIAKGIMVSIGHSAATYEDALHAFDLGIRSTTHTCNGMFPLHHRTPGVLGAILHDTRVKAEFIADLHHVHPAVIEMIYRIKGPDGCYFCTDSLEATGLSDGTYYNGTDPTPVIVKDGIALKNGGLAGSTLTMDQGLRNLVQVVGIPLEHALQMGTRNPADMIGRPDLGRITPGAAADFILLDSQLQVQATYVRGVCEYRR